MVNTRKPLVATIALASLLLASSTLAHGVSQAEEAILIPGATVFKRINPIYPIVATSYPDIGIHFHDEENPQVVKYSQNALHSDRAVLDGVKQASAAVRQNDGKVVIIGESMGSMVAWRVAAELARGPDAPSKDDVRVVLIAPPEAGVAEYFREGTYIPILNYRITRIAESPYPTTVVIGEYDGWADPPDRPWNLVSSANALAGIAYIHGPPIAGADPEDVPPENITEIPRKDEQHGPITTYFVPTENLPLTQVFRDFGVPDALVDKADEVVRPVVDAGYVRHDQPGDTRPYLHNGEIRRNVQSQQQAREPRAVGQDRREHPRELRQTVRKNLRDRAEAGLGQLTDQVEAGLSQLKKRIAKARAEREGTPPRSATGRTGSSESRTPTPRAPTG